MRTLENGESVGRFTVLGEIGRGGMAVVYKARQDDLGRLVALKVFNAAAAGVDAALLQRFKDEARHLARLSHPNIVQIYDVGEEAGLRYIAMEYIDGPTLADCIGTGRVDPEWVLRTVRDIARALQYAHDNGVLHRDITPGNIKMRHGRSVPVIMDFGLSRELAGDGSGAREGLMVGTAAYMAPEQADNRAVDRRADIFPLGVIMYELLTHNNPFRAPEGLKQTVVNVLTRDPRPLRRVMPWLERDVETITHKALEKEPGCRYATAGALADDIDRHLAGDPIMARPSTWLFRTYRRLKKHRGQAVTVVALSVLLGVAVGGYLRLAAFRARQLGTVRIVHVQGEASVHPAAGGTGTPARVGMVLDGPHTVRTGPGGSMTVMIGNAIKTVEENTRVEFSFKRERGRDEIAVTTLFGSLLSEFDGYDAESRHIKILTPGFNTEPEDRSAFNVHVEETGHSEIQVFRGNVVIAETPDDTAVILSGGSKLTSTNGGGRGPVERLSQDDVDDLRNRLSPYMFARLLGGGGRQPAQNHAPVIAFAPPGPVAAGVPGSWRIAAEDPDGDPVLFRLLAGPGGMRIAPYDGILAWDAAPAGSTGIAVEAADGYGRADTLRFVLYGVADEPPRINVRHSPVPGTGRMTFLFDAARTEDETPGSLCFSWDFNGDGIWEYAGRPGRPEPVVQYTFPRTGRFGTVLRATDPLGNRSTRRMDVWAGRVCYADAGRDTTVNLNGTVVFRGEGFSRIGTITAYEWDFDGDGTTDVTLPSPRPVNRAYGKPGRYAAVLTVRDDRGQHDADTAAVTVVNAEVRASAGASALTASAGAAIELTGSGIDPDGRVTAYEWDFDGNGSVDWKSARTGRVTTRYREPGTYRARLTVRAEDGSVATAGVTVTVTGN